jgi:hypothetical protein
MKALIAGATRSRTIWFSVALAALSAVSLALDSIRHFLGEYAPLVGMAVAVGIAVLRVLTTLPLDAKAPPKDDDGSDSGV